MADSLTYRCNMLETHRSAANCREQFRCHRSAAFIVSPAQAAATRDNSKLACIQHTAKAVRWVMGDSSFHQVKVTAVGEVKPR
ncbi:MAG TPA: hypothetical protein VGL02_01310 [Streptomyces sp.]